MSTNSFKPIHRSESESRAQAAPQTSALSDKLERSISPTATRTALEAVTEVIAKIQELFRIRKFSFVPPSANPKRYEQDDLGMGYLYADNFKNLLHFVRDVGEWYYYFGGIWVEDKGGIIARQCAKALVEYLKAILLDEEFLAVFSKRTKRETMLKEAKDVYSISLSDFDTDPYLLNCLNGTFDLRTSQFRPHEPSDFLTKRANVRYNPDAKCER